MEVTREMAHAMAKWWGEKISGSGSRHDNGDHNNMASVFAGILADTMNEYADGSKVDKFVDILTEKILNDVKGHGRLRSGLLDCDYAPSQFLSEAAKEAGIKPDNFPWKTSMIICENAGGQAIVKAHAGYGASWEQIYPIKKQSMNPYYKEVYWGAESPSER